MGILQESLFKGLQVFKDRGNSLCQEQGKTL